MNEHNPNDPERDYRILKGFMIHGIYSGLHSKANGNPDKLMPRVEEAISYYKQTGELIFNFPESRFYSLALDDLNNALCVRNRLKEISDAVESGQKSDPEEIINFVSFLEGTFAAAQYCIRNELKN